MAQDYEKGVAAANAGDYAKALKEWGPLAEAGDRKAQYSLGVIYNNGDGIPQDYGQAAKWWKLAAEQGSAAAQYQLGILYLNGNGVLQDYKQTVKWWGLAAEQGYAAAQYQLGVLFRNGQGVLQDYKQAVKWWRLAAEQGSAAAQNILGLSYVLGEGGVGKDLVLAHMWLNIAAANGNDTAAKMRKNVTEQMSPAALEKAQAKARKCMESNYKECGY